MPYTSIYSITTILLSGPTAGVTGKGGIWRRKPPDAESAVWGRFPESAGERPHLSGARGVGRVFARGFEFELDYCIYR